VIRLTTRDYGDAGQLQAAKNCVPFLYGVLGILSCMATPTISIPVDDSIADAFRAASIQRQRQLQILLGLRLRELTTRPQRSLDEILDQVGRAAESKGLTPTLLDSMLGES